jgi:hypothetical protein
MKALFLLPLAALPLFLTACEAVVVDRYPRRTVAYVERDDYYRRHHPYHREAVVVSPRPGYRRETIVVNPRPAYRPNVEVRYYNDTRGRYYFKGGRRIYVNSGVYY